MRESEIKLVTKAKQGDMDAFEELVKGCGPRLLKAVLAIVGNPQDAEDIVQESFLKALKKLGQFQEKASFTTWLHRIAYNRSYDHLRRRREVPVEQIPFQPGKLDREKDLAYVEREELKGMLRKLSPEHQLVLLLRHYEDYSLQEIAETLEIPLGTVKSRLYYSYQQLRLELAHLKEGETSD